jgi:hypothetical protein
MNWGQIRAQQKLFLAGSATTSGQLDANLDEWTNMRLRELYRLQRWSWLQQQEQVAVTAGAQLYTLSSPAIYAVSFVLDGRWLREVPEGQALAFYGTASGTPRAFSTVPTGATEWSQFKLWPTPAANGTLVVTVTRPLADLALDTDSNFLTLHHPFLVVAAGVSLGMRYLREYEMAERWEAIYQGEVEKLVHNEFQRQRAAAQHEPVVPFGAPQTQRPALTGG